MIPLEILLERNAEKIKGDMIDLGEFDVNQGYEGVFYLRNPNKYAKANLQNLKNKNPLVELTIPDTIEPLMTEPVYIKIANITFSDNEEEEQFFQNIYDSLSGQIKWVPI